MTASKRSRAEILAEVTSGLVSVRQQQRDARAYAEVWYQALRAWETSWTEVQGKFFYGPARASTMRVVGIGNYSTSGTGQGGSFMAGTEEVQLPNGKHPSRIVGGICTRDPLLSEVRRGAGLATLLHASGRGWAGERARAYARAVLGLAVELGDDAAGVHLQALVFAEDSRTISLESQD